MADEPTPAEPGQGGAPAETQDKPKTWWEARGFKSEEEALAAWESNQKELTEKNQRLASAERTIQAIVSAPPKAPQAPAEPSAPGYRRYFEGNALEEAYASGDASRFAETLMAGVERAIRNGAVEVYSHQEELRAIRDGFYAENKDLKPYPELVKLYSQEVGSENPNMTVKDAMGEVAKRVRARVAAIKRGEDTPAGETPGAPKPKDALPHSGPGGDGAPAGAPPAKPAEVVEDVAAEVKRRMDLRGKKTILR